MGHLYTIGHSTIPDGQFLDLLEKYKVNYVLDVRSTPFSKYSPQFNSNIIKSTLEKKGIQYFAMGTWFGARQPDKSFYPKGYLDFELFRASELFKKGMNNVMSGLEQNNNIALMCTEKNPIDCHRAIMVARGFELAGVEVNHILHSADLLSQKELNNLLVEMYFPERGQLSLFESDNKSDEDYIREAYKLRNEKIGYRFGNDKEGETQ